MHERYNNLTMHADITDASIRSFLIERLRLIENANSAFINEFFISNFSRRADLVVANGFLSAFEIKSASDNIVRLPGQLDAYCRYFEKVTVICSERHLKSVLDIAPVSVGVWSINDVGLISYIRNSRRFDIHKKTWISFLPVDILRVLLRKNGLSAVGDRSILEKRVFSNILKNDIRNFVLNYFKDDRYRRVEKIKLKNQERVNSSKKNLMQTQYEKDLFIEAFASSLDSSKLIPIPRKLKD